MTLNRPRILLIGAGSYFFTTQKNPITGEKQRISLTPDQEIQLGLQAAPEMASEMGGEEPLSVPVALLAAALVAGDPGRRRLAEGRAPLLQRPPETLAVPAGPPPRRGEAAGQLRALNRIAGWQWPRGAAELRFPASRRHA